jgi:DNA polymerase-3 subunit delta
MTGMRADADGGGGAGLSLVLIQGDEELLVGRAIADQVRSARAEDPDVDVREFAGATVSKADLLDACSPNLFGGRRVTVVRKAEEMTVDRAPTLVSLIGDPAPGVTLVVQHSGGARGKPVLEAARKAGAHIVVCAPLTRAEERSAFVRAEVRRARGSITPDAEAALLDAVGTDLREIAAVSAQLVADSGGMIDAGVVAAYHRGRAEVTGFAVADRAVVGDVAGALETLRWALMIGVPPVLIADALADGVRSVARVTAAGRGSDAELASRLGMPPWKVRRARAQARGWGELGIGAALQVAAQVNGDVKGVAVDAGYALERAVRGLAEARGSTGGRA